MPDNDQSYDLPQDTGTPDEVESDLPIVERSAEETTNAELPAASRPETGDYAETLGISGDFAGGSMPDEIRTPPPAE
jgi:hypothetical protein